MDQYIWGRSPPDLSDDRDKKLLFPQQEIFVKIVYADLGNEKKHKFVSLESLGVEVQ